MMVINIPVDAKSSTYVDRDGVATVDLPKTQGFNVNMQNITVHFDDENDALSIAKMIIARLES